MPFTSKRQQRAAFGGHIPGFSKEKAKEWAKETPDMKGLPERAPAEKGKHTLRAKKAELAHAHDSGKGLSEAAIARGVKVELEHTKDPGVARQIAIDHLRERPDYYARLADAEKSTMRKKSSLQNRSQAHTDYFVEMNLAKLASGEPVAPVLGEKRRSAGVGDNIPPQTDFAQAVEGDPVKAAADDRAGRISDRIDDVGIGLLAAPYAASLAGHGLAKSKNPKLRAAGAALERGLGTESRFGKSHGRELAGLAMVAPGVTHTMAKGINKVLPKEKGAADQTVLSDHSDPPGYMMVQNLNRLTDQSKQLAKAVSVKDNAEPWVESKIDRASEAIDAVHDYMKYKAKHHEPDPKHASVDFFLKTAKDTASGTLSEADRDKIKHKNFAIPKGEKYPIHDEEHARNALARVAQFGSMKEQAQVRAAVAKKYPGIDLTEASRPEKRASLSLGLRAINASIQRDRERAREYEDYYRKHASIVKIAQQLYPEWEYLTTEEQEKIAFDMAGIGTGVRNLASKARGLFNFGGRAAKAEAGALRSATTLPRQVVSPSGARFAAPPPLPAASIPKGGTRMMAPADLRAAVPAAPRTPIVPTTRMSPAAAPAPAPAAATVPSAAAQPPRSVIRVESAEQLKALEAKGMNTEGGWMLDPRDQMLYPPEARPQFAKVMSERVRGQAARSAENAKTFVTPQEVRVTQNIRPPASRTIEVTNDMITSSTPRVTAKSLEAGAGRPRLGSAASPPAVVNANQARPTVPGRAQPKAGPTTTPTSVDIDVSQLGPSPAATPAGPAATPVAPRQATSGRPTVVDPQAATRAQVTGQPTSVDIDVSQLGGASQPAARATQSVTAPQAAATISPAATPATTSGATPVTSAAPEAAAANVPQGRGPGYRYTPGDAPLPAGPPINSFGGGDFTPLPPTVGERVAKGARTVAKGTGKVLLPALGVAGAGLGVGGVTAAYGLKSLANAGNEDHGPLAGPAYVGPGRGF